MMPWMEALKADPLPWLLEAEAPGVRYLALRDLLDRPAGDPELQAAQKLAHTEGPIAAILGAMHEAGYWVEPGPGYNPKYRSTVWSLVMLAQLGASVALDERIPRACRYLLEHALASGGRFTMDGAPSGTIDCLHGNLCWALRELGYADPRLDSAFDWLARSVTGDGIAPITDRQAPVRYYSGKCGPNFSCGGNNKLPCAWGAVKVMLALGTWPTAQRTPLMEQAIAQGVTFFFSTDPAQAGYPCGWAAKPSGNWWKLGFPVFYVTDLLQLVEALVSLGYGRDPRLANAWSAILEKQDALGRWPLEYDYAGKTWVDCGPKKQPNKWVTLRALRVLKAAAGE
jgi:hypothetical protein